MEYTSLFTEYFNAFKATFTSLFESLQFLCVLHVLGH